MTDSNDKPADQTPPWGDDFDAERAWTLIQNLRGEKSALQTERDELRTERDSLQTERETREAEATSATERATKAERELHVERALRKHKVPDDLVDLVRGDTEEEVLAMAERLAKFATPEKQEPEEEEKEEPAAPQLPAKPRPKLQPGHGGDAGEPNDLDAIVKSVRG
jgi:hypothetical protein